VCVYDIANNTHTHTQLAFIHSIPYLRDDEVRHPLDRAVGTANALQHVSVVDDVVPASDGVCVCEREMIEC
jgi:hypothetical protein